MCSMNRREFLRAAGIVGGAAMLGGTGLLACSDSSVSANGPSAGNVPRLPLPPDSVLGHPAPHFPIHAHIARRFTVTDRHHASLLGPTFPNRQYIYSAQSEGLKESLHPLDFGQYSGVTIFEHLARAGVEAAEYFTNLPIALCWGARMFPFVRTVDRFFSDAEEGRLPAVTFVTPWVGGPFRTDDHPRGDIAL